MAAQGLSQINSLALDQTSRELFTNMLLHSNCVYINECDYVCACVGTQNLLQCLRQSYGTLMRGPTFLRKLEQNVSCGLPLLYDEFLACVPVQSVAEVLCRNMKHKFIGPLAAMMYDIVLCKSFVLSCLH